jgi:hypothetical protein
MDAFMPEGRQYHAIPSENWQPGLYIIEISDGQERIALKAVKY